MVPMLSVLPRMTWNIGARCESVLICCQPVRQRARWESGMLLKFHGSDIFTAGRLCFRQSCHRHRRQDDPRWDCDFVIAGGADAPILPELIHGFSNMNATIKIHPQDRAYAIPRRLRAPSAPTAGALSLPRVRGGDSGRRGGH